MVKDDPNVISTEDRQYCECCGGLKLCRMYVLANLTAAWVCKDCRKGKSQ